jgi:hypothetical protein
VRARLKAHFKVDNVDKEFIDSLISEIIKEDQLARMGSIIKFLKTE